MIPSPCDKQKLNWTKNQYIPDEIYDSSFFDVFLWNLYYLFSIPMCGLSKYSTTALDSLLYLQALLTIWLIGENVGLIMRTGISFEYVFFALILSAFAKTLQFQFFNINLLIGSLSIDVLYSLFLIFKPAPARAAYLAPFIMPLRAPINPIAAAVHPDILLNRRLIRLVDTTPLHFSAAAAGGKR